MQVLFNAAAITVSELVVWIYAVRCFFNYLEGELVHVPGLWQRSAKLEHIPHAIPGKKGRAGEEFLNLWLVQPKSSVNLKGNIKSDDVIRTLSPEKIQMFGGNHTSLLH